MRSTTRRTPNPARVSRQDLGGAGPSHRALSACPRLRSAVEVIASSPRMRDGPPPWLDPPALATAAPRDVGDASVHAEIWDAGVRLHVEGRAEDDAAWDDEPWSTNLCLEAVVCLCETLSTGQDATFEEEAWGRTYRRVFSFDSHTSRVEPDPAAREVWFYPMNERRLALRVAAGPLIPALTALFRWARWELCRMEPAAQRRQAELLARGLSLLGEAGRRIRRRSLGRRRTR